MSLFSQKITATFDSPQFAGKFAKKVDSEIGNPPDRDGAVVTVIVHGHGTDCVLIEAAKELGGEVTVEVLEDDE